MDVPLCVFQLYCEKGHRAPCQGKIIGLSSVKELSQIRGGRTISDVSQNAQSGNYSLQKIQS